ncbi:MAG: DNA recombination protein RmuC [Burkholderiales bacterium]|nr:DNA recombination protein RmuC [Burkholderiales bacterium]
MPFDWILLALLVLVLLSILWLALRRADPRPMQALRDELLGAVRTEVQHLERELRDEVARSASGTRTELASTLASLQQTLLTQQGDVARTQNEQIDGFRTQLAATQQLQADTLGRAGEQQALSLQRFAETLTEQLRALSQSNDQRMAEVRTTVEQKLAAIQADNEKKLEQMRATVDEKLHATLEQRLGESFKQVADRLEQVHRGLGEMQLLAKDVGSLNRVLTNVKTRGIFGEVQLANLLEQVFTPDQYAVNVETVPGSGARVEFAIRLPGRRDDGAPLWLPIDAKFPREDYERLLDAQERADAPGAEAAGKAIEQRLRMEARTIREKYVAPPHTTEFAILFVPTEGLYAEALRRPGLMESLQRESRVTLAGPTTLLATLTSLQMGFRTLALEQRSAEVWEVLGAVKTEFAKFGEVLARTKKKLDEASSTIDLAQTRTNVMARKLKSVEALSDSRTQLLLPGAEMEPVDDESA